MTGLLRSSRVVILTIPLALMEATAGSNPQGSVWTTGGPHGGPFLSLVTHPSKADVLYAGTSWVGAFKSTDGGDTWVAANQGLVGQNTQCLAVDPISPGVLYAGTRREVYKSTNDGLSWQHSNVGFPSFPESTDILSLALDPITPATLYAGTYQRGVYKSTDAGGSWTTVNTGLGNLTVESLAVNPTAPSLLYAGTRGSGVFRTLDGGAHWAPANNGLPGGLTVRAFAIDPSKPSVVYAGTNGEDVFKSTDSGGTWLPSYTGPTVENVVVALVIQASAPHIVFAGISASQNQGRVLKSTDSGTTWLPASGLGNRLRSLAAGPSPTGRLYAATLGGPGIFRSNDAAASWFPSNSGLTNVAIQALAIDPAQPTAVYAASWEPGGGVHRSTNGGVSWEVSFVNSQSGAYDVAVAHTEPSTVYAGALGQGIFKSTNSGGTWAPANNGLTSTIIQAIAISPASAGTVYAGTADGGLFKSTDAGGSWSPSNIGLPTLSISVLAIAPSNPSWLYAYAALEGIYRSTDAGGSWMPAGSEFELIDAIAIDPLNPSTVYAGGSGMYKSTDSGASWAPLAIGPGDAITAIAIHPSDSAVLFAGSFWSGVRRSTDAGGTWSAVNRGLPYLQVRALALDGSGEAALYAGTIGSVWQSSPPVPVELSGFRVE